MLRASILACSLISTLHAIVPDDVPIPTPAQLKYQRNEIAALIHFNMATFAHNGDPGCAAENWNKKQPYAAGISSDPATFHPTNLNTTQWAQVAC